VHLIDYLTIYSGLTLELLLLWRVRKARLFEHYLFFSAYFLYVFLRSFVLFFLFALHSRAFATIYWPSNLIGAVLWFAVVWEVFRKTFPRDFRLRRIATEIFLVVLLFLALVFYLSGPQLVGHPVSDFMRKIALSEVVLLLTILALARYYRVSLGRNIWGMAVGLLALVSSYVADFAAIDISPAFQPIWRMLIPLGFILMLLIWIATLWSYYPNPKPVASDAPAHEQARSFWEKRWAAIGTTIRRAVKP
jgi:hypothetical protein